MYSANPLLIDLENPSSIRSKRARLWFSGAAFANLETERDEEAEIQHMIKSYESKGGKLWSRTEAEEGTGDRTEEPGGAERDLKRRKVTWEDEEAESSGGSDAESVDEEGDGIPNQGKDDDSVSENSDSDSADELWDNKNTQSFLPSQKVKGDSFEVVPMETKSAPVVRKLDPEGLALGALLVQSKKKREDIIESGYNRWTHTDDNLADWFHENEAKFCQKQLPVTKEMVQEYREKLREINARPIKKIAEAKARRKRKALKQMEKARKKAESITDAIDVSNSEKVQQIKQIYKKAGLVGTKKKEVKYVVAKKALVSKRGSRPPGTKGPYRIVDPRMKKDNRARKKETMKRRQKKKSKKR